MHTEPWEKEKKKVPMISDHYFYLLLTKLPPLYRPKKENKTNKKKQNTKANQSTNKQIKILTNTSQK